MSGFLDDVPPTPSAPLQIQSRGIHHALPVYPHDVQGLTAIITGANGISGHYMLRVLAQSPHRWKKIWCLSRRPPMIPSGRAANAEHVALDFLKEPQEIAAALKEKGVTADYIFFFSYIQAPPKAGKGLWSDASEMVRLNTALLSNFLNALSLSSITPRRILLQTGAKNYGVHLGPVKQPMEESDPRVTLEPNFYYPQEDTLAAWCEDHASSYTIAMPGMILGAVPDAAMNGAFPLAVYAAVCAHLHEPLAFPGDLAAWGRGQASSSSALNAYFEEWAVLAGGEAAAGEKFNICDGCAFAWEKFWPRLAWCYGIEWRGPELEGEYLEMESAFNPPPRGWGPPAKFRARFTLASWAKQPKVQQAWKEIAAEHDLSVPELRDVDRIFGFIDGNLCSSGPGGYSMSKSRNLGWHGYVDTTESYLEVFDDFAKLKMIPPVPLAAKSAAATSSGMGGGAQWRWWVNDEEAFQGYTPDIGRVG